MFEIKRLEIKNILSHKDSIFENTSSSKLTLIYGVNVNNNGSDSNGSGKSVIPEAITIAITGESYRDLNNDEFIRDGETDASVRLILKNTHTNIDLEIYRTFKRGGTSKVQILEGNEQIQNKELVSVKKANEYIYECIGISKEDLFNYFIINQGNNASFFSNTDVKQKEVVSRFANFNEVQKIHDELCVKSKEITTRKTQKEREVFSMDNLILQNENDIEEALIRQKEELKDTTQVFLDEIKTNEENISLFLEDCKDKEDKLITIKEKIKSWLEELELYQEDEKNLKKNKDKLDLLEEEITDLRLQIRKLDAKINSSVCCPSCKHEFLIGDNKNDNLEELKSLKVECDDLIKENEKLKLICVNKIQSLKLILEKKVKISETISKLKIQVREYESELSHSRSEINTYQKRNTQLAIKINNERSNSTFESLIVDLKNKLNDRLNSLKILNIELSVIDEELLENDSMIYHFGKKGFMTYLANKTIKVIEIYINTYLEKYSTGLSVKINGYKLLKNGEVREKIETFVVKNSISVGRYSRFSGGQRMRINLCAILTFQKLINMSLPLGKGLNLLILDEVLDGLDRLGNQFSLNILNSSKISTLVISHNNPEEFTSEFNRIFVHNQNDISYIK